MIAEIINKKKEKISLGLEHWAQQKIAPILIYILSVLFVMLLRSAGYFHPFYPISVNFVVFFAIIMAILIMGMGITMLGILTLLSWSFAGLLLLLGVNVWAERTAFYSYQLLVLLVVMVVLQSILQRRKSH